MTITKIAIIHNQSRLKGERYLEGKLKITIFVIIIMCGIYIGSISGFNNPTMIGVFSNSLSVTFGLTFGAVIIGLIVGIILAFLRILDNKILNFLIDEYIDILRGTPVAIQLLVFAYIILYALSNNFYAALIAFGLNSSAYIAEIIRAGINSVDKGQVEASRAMGLNFFQTNKEIVFPQAIKNILPSLVNEVIAVFKDTSIVSIISVTDITMLSKNIQAQTYSAMPIIFMAFVYYIFVKIFSYGGKSVERYLNKND